MSVETNQGLSAHEVLEDPNSPIVVIGQILCVNLPLVIWFVPLPIEPVTQHALAIVGFMVVAWITRAMDYALAGMIGCFLFWALRIVRFPVAFSGFANDTAWFLFGALLLGVIATQSGVARRLAYFVMLKVGTTYPTHSVGSDRYRLPADLRRPVRNRPRGDHGLDSARTC